MSTHDNLETQVQQQAQSSQFLVALLITISSGTAGIGFDQILPGTGWVHYTLVAAMTLSVFGCLKLVWGWQFAIFLRLAAGKPSKLAICTHLLGVALTTLASLSPTFIGVTFEAAALHDMHHNYEIVMQKESTAKRNYKAVTSIHAFIESQAGTVLDLRDQEEEGDFSLRSGRGPVWRVYDDTLRSLGQLLALIDSQQERYEEIVANLGLTQTKMRRALESDLNSKDMLSQYSDASRTHADSYGALLELSVVALIEVSLSSFADSVVPAQKAEGDAKEALRLAKKHARDTASAISHYVNERVIPLKPILAYQPDSPAVVVWRYIDRHWSQFAICASLDLSLWFVLLMQIAALQETRARALNNQTQP
jgi:hypothetical protein